MVLNFYAVWGVREDIYGFQMPDELSSWVSFTSGFKFDVGGFLFPSWTCLGDLGIRLAVNGLWPFCVIFMVIPALLIKGLIKKQPAIDAFLAGLKLAIFVSFCLLPNVSESLFLAFQCETYGMDDLNGGSPPLRSFLTASLNVECGTPDHTRLIIIAAIFLSLWPLAMPIMYSVLLKMCSKAIINHHPTKLSRAVAFLWGEYKDEYYWWEIVETYKKLILTNAVLFIDIENGSTKLLRLVVGLIVSLFGLVLQLSARPLKNLDDDAISCMVQIMLAFFFIAGIVIKLCEMESGSCTAIMGIQSAYHVSIVMISVGFIVMLGPFVMLLRRVNDSMGTPTLRIKPGFTGGGNPPILHLDKTQKYHLFLSHSAPRRTRTRPVDGPLRNLIYSALSCFAVWSTGQDQCAVIKRQMQLLLPGVVVFLDVDDLVDIGDLEGYVRSTVVMMFFLSKKYFSSRNCLREIDAALNMEKHIALMHEAQEDKGGGTLEVLMNECSEDRRPKIFKPERTPIQWHRISHYQKLTLKLLATEVVRNSFGEHQTAMDHDLSSIQGVRNAISHAANDLREGAEAVADGVAEGMDAVADGVEQLTKRGKKKKPKKPKKERKDPLEEGPIELYLPGEMNIEEMKLPKPYVLWCSPANPGCAAACRELLEKMGGGEPAAPQGSSRNLMRGESSASVDEMSSKRSLSRGLSRKATKGKGLTPPASPPPSPPSRSMPRSASRAAPLSPIESEGSREADSPNSPPAPPGRGLTRKMTRSGSSRGAAVGDEGAPPLRRGLTKGTSGKMSRTSKTKQPFRIVEGSLDEVILMEGEEVAMMLYLNKDTWVDEGECEKGTLEKQVNLARELVTKDDLISGSRLMELGASMTVLEKHKEPDKNRLVKIILIHENDAKKGACDFGNFFGTTPQELINNGIYSDIAIALHLPPHRDVSFTLVAQALGGVKMKKAELKAHRAAMAKRKKIANLHVESSADADDRGGGRVASAGMTALAASKIKAHAAKKKAAAAEDQDDTASAPSAASGGSGPSSEDVPTGSSPAPQPAPGRVRSRQRLPVVTAVRLSDDEPPPQHAQRAWVLDQEKKSHRF